MIKARSSFENEEQKRNYVLECEGAFEHRLDVAVNAIKANENHRIITLSGPTCAGKTTTAKKIVSEFAQIGYRVHPISIDDFFLDRDYLLEQAKERNGEIDFDSAKALDLPRLSETVEQILKGGIVKVPRFDFKSGKRVQEREFLCGEKDIYMFEGIQAVYPEFTSLLRGQRYVGVFISVFDELELNGKVYRSEDIRLLRRIVRDFCRRNASAEFTLHLWQSVRQNELDCIFPNVKEDFIFINSLMPYELGMLKPFLFEMLSSVSLESAHYNFTQETMASLGDVDVISSQYIPENSLYHEFLG
jgi:uridine kinase